MDPPIFRFVYSMAPTTMKILGQTFSATLPVGKALQALYGIGKAQAQTYCAALGVLASLPLSQLSKDHSMRLTALGEALYVGEYQLKRRQHHNLRTLVETSSYRGFRHRAGLPCRGQRTSSNARTAGRIRPLRKKG